MKRFSSFLHILFNLIIADENFQLFIWNPLRSLLNLLIFTWIKPPHFALVHCKIMPPSFQSSLIIQAIVTYSTANVFLPVATFANRLFNTICRKALFEKHLMTVNRCRVCWIFIGTINAIIFNFYLSIYKSANRKCWWLFALRIENYAANSLTLYCSISQLKFKCCITFWHFNYEIIVKSQKQQRSGKPYSHPNKCQTSKRRLFFFCAVDSF